MGNRAKRKEDQASRQKGKYYKKILASVFAALLLVTIVVSSLMISTANDFIKNYNKQIDKTIMNHMQSFTQYLYETSERACRQIYASSFARDMLYGKNPRNGNDYFDTAKKMANISTLLVDVDEYVDSFIIYSSVSGRTFSSKHGLNYQDRFLNDYIQQHESEKGEPVLRNLTDDKGNLGAKVITFSFIDYNKDGSVYNGVFINVKVSWLKQKLKLLYNENKLDDGCVLLMKDTGELITYIGADDFISSEALGQIQEEYKKNGARSLIPMSVSGNQYYVSTIPIQVQNMYVTRIQYANVVNEPLYSFLRIAILILLICIILSIAVAWLITRIIYKPIGTLTNKVNNNPLSDKLAINEIELLNEAYDSIGDIKDAMEESQKRLALYELFTENNGEDIDLEGFEQLSKLNIDPNNPITLVQIKVDNDDIYDQSQYADQIARVGLNGFSVEIIRKDMLTLICLVQTPEESDRTRIIEGFKSCCESELTWQTYAIVISDRYDDCSKVSVAYSQITEIYGRRYFSEERVVLTSANAIFEGVDVWNNLSIVFDAESKVIEGIRSGENIEKALGEYLDLFQNYEYTDIGVFRSHFIQSIWNLVEQANAMRSVPVSVNIRELDDKILLSSTVIETKRTILPFVIELSNELQTDKENKYSDIVRLIKEIVEHEYSNHSLCLGSISEKVNLSPNYVGRLFKVREGISVAAYITDIRLAHAAELIENTNLKMNTILEHVGFTNQSSFYKSFKQKYLVTPKDYAVSKRAFREESHE